MKASVLVGCVDFPCTDVRHEGYVVPSVEVDPQAVKIVLISEAAPASLTDWYNAPGDPLFAQTTVLAFRDAGADVMSIADIHALGVYLTAAIKCGKMGYGISTGTIKTCAATVLRAELAQFPNVKAWLLMGDVAIRAVNEVARLSGEPRVIPGGSTYKIRGQAYFFRGARAFPSYLQAGPSFFIEKSKRAMIAQDIAEALEAAK